MKLILLVEDSAVTRKTMDLTLQMHGYKTASASDGLEALQLIEGGLRPDLVLTDINMPNMDGMVFIREARKRLKFIPIVALTTDARIAAKDQAKADGASGWLIKPVGGQELLKVVQLLAPNSS